MANRVSSARYERCFETSLDVRPVTPKNHRDDTRIAVAKGNRARSAFSEEPDIGDGLKQLNFSDQVSYNAGQYGQLSRRADRRAAKLASAHFRKNTKNSIQEKTSSSSRPERSGRKDVSGTAVQHLAMKIFSRRGLSKKMFAEQALFDEPDMKPESPESDDESSINGLYESSDFGDHNRFGYRLIGFDLLKSKIALGYIRALVQKEINKATQLAAPNGVNSMDCSPIYVRGKGFSLAVSCEYKYGSTRAQRNQLRDAILERLKSDEVLAKQLAVEGMSISGVTMNVWVKHSKSLEERSKSLEEKSINKGLFELHSFPSEALEEEDGIEERLRELHLSDRSSRLGRQKERSKSSRKGREITWERFVEKEIIRATQGADHQARADETSQKLRAIAYKVVRRVSKQVGKIRHSHSISRKHLGLEKSGKILEWSVRKVIQNLSSSGTGIKAKDIIGHLERRKLNQEISKEMFAEQALFDEPDMKPKSDDKRSISLGEKSINKGLGFVFSR